MDLVANDKSLHFTYKECDTTQLKQGDILRKTPSLVALLEEVHPHYTNTEYKYFQVLTQSCDLVRRGGSNCRSRYITLAAVRSLDDVIQRYISDNTSALVVQGDTYCSDNQKSKVLEFLQKLFNNTEKEYFFLQESAEHGVDYHCCTLLYLSVAIRAYEHYDLCLEAKCLELVDNFQSKLGWLVGNLYSRVGTDDYVPAAVISKKMFNRQLNDILDEHVVWVPKNRYSIFSKIAQDVEDIEEIDTQIEFKLKEQKNIKLSAILEIVKKTIAISEHDEASLKNLFSNDPNFQKLIS